MEGTPPDLVIDVTRYAGEGERTDVQHRDGFRLLDRARISKRFSAGPRETS